MLPLAAIGAGVGGVAKLLEAMGVFNREDPEEKKKEAMRKYLEANMPTLDLTDKQYGEEDFKSQLDPLRERQDIQQSAFGNSVGLRGLGRSGVGAEMVLQNERRNANDYANKFGGLVKGQQDRDKQLALQKYQADLEKAKLMASVQ